MLVWKCCSNRLKIRSRWATDFPVCCCCFCSRYITYPLTTMIQTNKQQWKQGAEEKKTRKKHQNAYVCTGNLVYWKKWRGNHDSNQMNVVRHFPYDPAILCAFPLSSVMHPCEYRTWIRRCSMEGNRIVSGALMLRSQRLDTPFLLGTRNRFQYGCLCYMCVLRLFRLYLNLLVSRLLTNFKETANE